VIGAIATITVSSWRLSGRNRAWSARIGRTNSRSTRYGLEAVGGTLAVRSSVGAGSTLGGSIPAHARPYVATISPVMPGWNVQWNSVVPFGTVNAAATTLPGSTVPVDRSSESIVKLWP
jgi:hypothetical protein